MQQINAPVPDEWGALDDLTKQIACLEAQHHAARAIGNIDRRQALSSEIEGARAARDRLVAKITKQISEAC
jgi:hypothetical protein